MGERLARVNGVLSYRPASIDRNIYAECAITANGNAVRRRR